MKILPTSLSSKVAEACSGAMRSRRRGSFIVLVVGTLAMLSIIMIVYVAVGNADKRTSSSIMRRDKSDEVIAIFSDYAAQIIADDAVTLIPDSSETNSAGTTATSLPGGLFYIREAWDAPNTSWKTDSTTKLSATIATGISDPQVFRSVGLGDDPWLASTTPVWINFDPGTITTAPAGKEKTFANRRDWLHITNIAPDGRFVNLFNLRNNYDAAPGTGANRLNANLSLPDQNGLPQNNPVFGGALDFDKPAYFDSWQAGAFSPARGPFIRNGNTPISPDLAAYPPYQWADADGDGWFDSRWFELTDARGQSNGQTPSTFRSLLPADPTLRWFFAARIVDLSALVNVNTAGDMAKDPNLTANTLLANPRKTDVVGLSPSDVDMRRLFLMGDSYESILNGDIAPAAFKIVDGSTAGGSLYVGGYSNLRQPISGMQVMQDYRQYVPTLAAGLQSFQPSGTWTPSITAPAIEIGEGGYRALRGGLAAGKAPARFTDFSIDPLKTQAVNFAEIRDRQTYYNTLGGLLARPVYDTSTSRFNFGTGFRIDSLIELLTYRGVNDPSVTSSLEMAVGGRLSSQLAKAPTAPGTSLPVPYSPLRDNRTLEFEREALSMPDGTPTEAALLKSYVDVRQYLTTLSGARPIAATFYRPPSGKTVSFDNPPDLLNTTTSPTNAPTPNLPTELTYYIMKGAEKNVDKTVPATPKNYTGIPLAETLFAGYAAALMPGFPVGMTEDAAPTLSADAWTPGPTANSLRGLFYGHQGPLTALLAAGHMTANFMSNFQRPPYTVADLNSDKQPFYDNAHLPYTIILNEEALTAAALPETPRTSTDSGITPDSPWKQFFPAWWASWRANQAQAASQTNQAFPTHQLNLARTQAERGLTATDRPMPRIATVATQVPVPAANLYGVGDPHPFIVEVASFTVYRDIPDKSILDTNKTLDPANVGGDLEQGAMFAAASTGNTLITLNGNVTSPANGDLMFQAVAIKVHNPHAQPIQLSDLSSSSSLKVTNTNELQLNDRSNFYVQIGGDPDRNSPSGTRTFFALADVQETAGATGAYDDGYTVKPVVILPGESIVFYALNWDSHSIMSGRLGYYDRDLGTKGLKDSSTVLEGWLDAQIGPRVADPVRKVRRVQMLRADSNFEKDQPSYATFKFGELFPNVEGTNAPDQTVMLKRPIRADSGTLVNDSIASGAPNSIWNDQICDRFRLGKEIGLNRRLLGKTPDFIPQNNSSIAMAGFEFSKAPINAEIGRNRRYSVTIGVDIRRSGDPAGDKWKPGALPAWAIDPKDSVAFDSSNTGWYDVQFVPASHKALGPTEAKKLFTSDEVAVNGAEFWGDTPKIWRDRQMAAPIFPTLSENPTSYPVRTALDDATKNKVGQTFSEARREFTSNPFQFQGTKLSSTDIVRNTPDQISQIRPTDLLNVMAIGCVETPVQDAVGTEIKDPYQRWTTTSELLAIAMNYTTAPAQNTSWKTDKPAGSSLFSYGPLDYYYFYHPPAGNPAKALFDGGYLRTDDFVTVRFGAGSGGTKAYTAGSGAPIAGNVLSTFRMNKDAFGALTSATSGLININTAPQAVLRTLPFTFPARDYATPITDTKAFWPGLTVDEAKKTDIAAMIESYRDKIAVELRPGARNGNAQQKWFAGFFDRKKPSITLAGDQDVRPYDVAIGDYTVTPSSYVGGRFWSSGITGIREGAGFRSVGELLAVRHIALDANGVPTTAPGFDLPNNIDFLGYRDVDKPANMLGTDNNFGVAGAVDATSGLFKFTDINPLEAGHTYQDKLKILSGLLGSITVRSDMYAVWFIARGYQRSDCEGLPAGQPMVPTVERRFLMVIDRSNVTRIGQKPRVLAFVEVPL